MNKLKYKNTLKKGIFITLAGMISMLFVATFVSYKGEGFLTNLLTVVFEPAGWFAVWYGLDHVFYLSKASQENLHFAKKVLGAQINFDGY